jgi:branched-chain amino acid transport system ATP-binding protein
MLKVENLTIKFGGLTAVDKVNFEIEQGSIFGLIGPNGAGKTTCFNMITGVYRPTGGRVIFNGKEIQGMEPYKINVLGIARTYQNINLFKKMTVLENTLVGFHTQSKAGLAAAIFRLPGQRKEEAAIREKSMEILRFMGLAEKAGLPASGLSYGEQRRLEISRAMASNPALLLLDEPAAGMNSKEKADLSNTIQRIRDRGITILLVEHDMKLIMKVTHTICVLNFGKKIAQGEPEYIQNHKEVGEAYLGSSIDG